jgi:hypothetical protein
MKTLLTVALLLFAFTQERDYDSIERDNIIIKNKLNQRYTFGSANELQKAFGKASIKKELNEEAADFFYLHRYKGLEVWFSSGGWETTIVKSRDYTVLLNGVEYKIGDHINKIKTQFPLSYQNRNKYDNNAIGIMISHNKAIYDAEVDFRYDNKGFITNITIANDNS